MKRKLVMEQSTFKPLTLKIVRKKPGSLDFGKTHLETRGDTIIKEAWCEFDSKMLDISLRVIDIGSLFSDNERTHTVEEIYAQIEFHGLEEVSPGTVFLLCDQHPDLCEELYDQCYILGIERITASDGHKYFTEVSHISGSALSIRAFRGDDEDRHTNNVKWVFQVKSPSLEPSFWSWLTRLFTAS
jgi:hypothetical protein